MRWVWLLLTAAAAWAQQPAPSQFDAASVKAVQFTGLAPSQITADRGRLKAQSVTVRQLIAFAYDVQPPQIVDAKSGPDRYDVEGKADGAHSAAELRVMLQGLLAERFRLRLHRETREIAVDRLVIDKDLKLKSASVAEADPRGFTLHASQRGSGFLQAKASAMSLEWLADDLSAHLSRLVVDGTGLKGLYEFEVDFALDISDVMDARVPVREAGNHIREALLAALGLKLQSGKKEQVEMLVIDQVRRPGAN
jgi:uncharacterized protein (TIGR03435 family)